MAIGKSICKYLKQDIDDDDLLVLSCEKGISVSAVEYCRSCPLYEARSNIKNGVDNSKIKDN